MKYIFALFLCMIFLPLQWTYADEELSVLNIRGKAGRGLLAMIGDGKTNNFGRPAAEHIVVDGISMEKSSGMKEGERGVIIEINGDTCNGDFCFGLWFIKSVRGALDLSGYSQLVFDIEVYEAPSDAFLLRVGGFPTRFEMDIRDRLPATNEGWKSITISLDEINANSLENFTLSYVPDAFSIGTPGKFKVGLSNIRWLP